jgi:hypothetical protein
MPLGVINLQSSDKTTTNKTQDNKTKVTKLQQNTTQDNKTEQNKKKQITFTASCHRYTPLKEEEDLADDTVMQRHEWARG